MNHADKVNQSASRIRTPSDAAAPQCQQISLGPDSDLFEAPSLCSCSIETPYNSQVSLKIWTQ
jgi:hypothetical protein